MHLQFTMGESKKDPLDIAYEQLLERVENFEPRRPFDSAEVEMCRRTTAFNMKAAYGQAWDSREDIERADAEENPAPAPTTTAGARSLIRHHLFADYVEEPGPKTKLQLNIPTGTAQLLEIWAKREDRPVSSCLMEAALRGLSAMKADGHIPAAVLEENEWHIRMNQVHEDMRTHLGESFFNSFED